MSARETLSRQREKHVLQWLARANVKEVDERVKSLPVDIRAQGLATAVALGTKNGTNRELFKNLGAWLVERKLVTSGTRGSPDVRELLTQVVNAKRADYLVLQAEAIVYFDQVKAFSAALGAEK